MDKAKHRAQKYKREAEHKKPKAEGNLACRWIDERQRQRPAEALALSRHERPTRQQRPEQLHWHGPWAQQMPCFLQAFCWRQAAGAGRWCEALKHAAFATSLQHLSMLLALACYVCVLH